MAILLDGKTLAAKIRSELKEEIKRLGTTPGLAVLLIGDNPASHTYVRVKEKAAAEVGMHFEKILLPQTIDEELVLVKIDELNHRKDIHGIIVQLPLPKPLRPDRIIPAILPEKDADGFHPVNIKNFLAGTPTVVPVTTQAIATLLDAAKGTFVKKRAIILANSEVFAEPIKKLLTDRDVLVTTVIAPKPNYPITQLPNYQIVITALGRPNAITKDMIKDGAIVIDVGTTRVDGKILGDVHPDVAEKAGWLSPVPGGVGPLTVAYILKNVVESAKRTARGGTS